MSVVERKWYVLRAVSGKESKVKEFIEAEMRNTDLGEYVFQVLIPTEKVYQVRNGKKIVKERTYLPGYVLVEAVLVGEVAHRLMREIQATRITLEALQQQKHELSYWRASDYRQRYELHKQEKSLLQKTYLFVDIGNVFLFMFKQRSLGTIVDFKRELMRYSRHRVKGPVVKPLSVWSLTSSLRK